jgi:acetyltransferase-like isoleucine patch superfamily enzyme
MITEHWIQRLKQNDQVRSLHSGLFYVFHRSRAQVNGKGNGIIRDRAYLRRCSITVNGNGNRIIIHPRARLSGCIISITGDGHRLEIGPDCDLKNSLFWFEGDHCASAVGARTTFEGVMLACPERATSIRIGADCMFSHNVEVRTGDSHSVCSLASGKRINPPRDVVIGVDVWIASDVRILRGVRIGAGAVVAIGSIVTRSVKANSLTGGYPNRTLMTGIGWSRQRI